MSKFREIYNCSNCGKETDALFQSGLVKNPCCQTCYDIQSRRTVEAVSGTPAGAVTRKTIEAGVKEIVK